jgi:hypothetical protein
VDVVIIDAREHVSSQAWGSMSLSLAVWHPPQISDNF